MVEKNAGICLKEFEDGAKEGNSSNSAGLSGRAGGCFGGGKEDGGRTPWMGPAGAVMSGLFGQPAIGMCGATWLRSG